LYYKLYINKVLWEQYLDCLKLCLKNQICFKPVIYPPVSNTNLTSNIWIFEQVIQYNLVWGRLGLINCEAVYEKRKLFQTRLKKYSLFKKHIPYNLIFKTRFNDSSILITIISCDYLNLSLTDEHVGDVNNTNPGYQV
jgi:hypothetical protein